MPAHRRSFEFIETQLRKKTFGVLGTIGPKGALQSTGILYGISAPDARLRFYLLTDRSYLKVRNISRDPEVSFLVTFPHHFFRFVPSSCISFSGKAKILGADDPEARAAFEGRRILRMNLEQASRLGDAVFIEIRPKRSMHCYGVGIGLMTIAKDPSVAGYSVEVPAHRL
jgi:hypothetical protein